MAKMLMAGERVRLKSGGLPMTVVSVSESTFLLRRDSRAYCTWCDGPHVRRGEFSAGALELLD